MHALTQLALITCMTLVTNMMSAGLKTQSTKSLAWPLGLALWTHSLRSGVIGLVALATALTMLDGLTVVYCSSFQLLGKEIRRGPLVRICPI